MASIKISPPGTEFGPCLDEACGHADCAESRAMASAHCFYCKLPIGYERQFFFSTSVKTDEREYSHRTCLIESIEKNKEEDAEALKRRDAGSDG